MKTLLAHIPLPLEEVFGPLAFLALPSIKVDLSNL